MHSARKQDAPASPGTASRSARRGEVDSGLSCLILVAYFHGIAANPEQLRHQLGMGGSNQRFSETDLLSAAKSLGLKAQRVTLRAERLGKMPMPALLLDRDQRHFVVARVSEDGTALIQEGSVAGPAVIPQSEVVSRSDGRALLFTSRASIASEFFMVYTVPRQISPIPSRSPGHIGGITAIGPGIAVDVSGGDGQGPGQSGFQDPEHRLPGPGDRFVGRGGADLPASNYSPP
jgi:hypothetical protein